MKTMKKLASLTLALLLTVALATPAFAAGETTPTTGSITITDTATNQTYHAYRLLDLKTYDNDTNTFLYTVNSDWAEFFADTENGGAKYVVINDSPDHEYDTYVTWKEDASAADLAAAAKAWLEIHTIAATATAVSTADGATFGDLDLGYYLIDSTVGTTCFLDTTNPNVEIAEKNELPTVTKKIVDGANLVDEITANYGDTITFEITVKFPESTTADITVNDTMAAGLSYTTGSLTVTAGDVTESTTDPLTFTLPANETNKAAGDVVFRYTAKLDVNAATATALTNSVNLTYMDGEEEKTTTTSTVTVYTYEFDLVKTKSDDTVLDGATFKLYGSENGTDEIPVILNADGTYSVVPAGTEGIVDITAGNVTIKGLADGTYYLEETAAPDGYNRMTTRAAVSSTVAVLTGEVVTGKDNNEATVTDGKYVSGGVQVINLTGAEMPSTGGIGTTIFYVVGGLLVVGAGVLLVTRKRAGEEE